MNYKEILENISDWLWAVDTSGKYTYCSQNVVDFLGYTAEEIIGKTPFDFMSEKESSRVSKIFEDLVIHRAPIKELENKNIHKDGSIVILKTSGVPVYDEDGIWLGYEGIDTNITEQSILEQTKVNYELLHKLTENVPGAIYQYRLYPDGRMSIPYISKGVENIYEISPQDVIHDASLSLKYIHPDDLSMIEASIKESAQTMKVWNLQYRVNLPKKGLCWLEGEAKPEKLIDGSILWHGVTNDITEQVVSKQKLLFQAEQLQQKKQELESIIQDAPNPMMLHNEDGIVLMINQAWMDLSGYSQEEIPSIDALLNCVYDDIEIRAKTKAHISFLYDITEKENEGEFTFLNKNREEITWQFSSAPSGMIDGKRTIISSAMDVTERKISEEREKIVKKELVILSKT
ncbi:PAS domain S-box protein, partial [Sulfurovum sp.]|uniref:PAS domain-containing protein n=1 Tax=Sulfurovum sp. TaxID=1969726 RepID=UPI002867FBA4